MVARKLIFNGETLTRETLTRAVVSWCLRVMLIGGRRAAMAAAMRSNDDYTTCVSRWTCGGCGRAGRGNDGKELWPDPWFQRSPQLCCDRAEWARVRSSLGAQG